MSLSQKLFQVSKQNKFQTVRKNLFIDKYKIYETSFSLRKDNKLKTYFFCLKNILLLFSQKNNPKYVVLKK